MTEFKKINNYFDVEFQKIFIQYFHKIGIEIEEDSDVFNSIAQSAEEEKMETLGLYKNDLFTGFLMYQVEVLTSASSFFEENVGFIREFYVSTTGKGYGTLLLSKVEEILKNQNIHKLILTTDSALGFYQKQGFIIDKSYVAKNELVVLSKLI